MDHDVYICPHCKSEIIIYKNELNCRIFRCGIFKSNNTQLNPHASEQECNRVKLLDLIYGCGKPFRISFDNVIEKCEYI